MNYDVTKKVPEDPTGMTKPNYEIRGCDSLGVLALQSFGEGIKQNFTVTKESAPIVLTMIKEFFKLD